LAVCGDTQVGLWVLRSLGMHGLKVYAVCKTRHGQAAHSRYCVGAWGFDRQEGAPSPVDQIETLARRLDVGSIMPIDEGHHEGLIRRRDRIEPHIHLFSPPAEPFAKAVDKHYLHQLCTELGIPVAKGTTLDKLMAAGGNGLQYPLVMRTRKQTGSNGKAPWKAAYAVDRKQLDNLYRKVESFADNVIVQEYHPGVEDHIQILMHRGEAFMVGEYVGEHHMPLAGGVTVQRVTCRHRPLIRDAVRLLQAIGWEGIAAVQYHYDPKTEDYVFLEINPRYCGGLPSVIMAGFHAPFLLWQTHFEPEKMRKTPYRLGLRTRILGGDANWLFGMIRGDRLPPDQKRLGKLSALARFLWNWGPWTKDDSFAWGDMKPFVVDFMQMVKRLGSEAFNVIGAAHSQDNIGDKQ
jgi:predicted ATP-grasp superfamily ATP-dependent carboligase